MTRSKKLGHIEWSEPEDYLNIDWKRPPYNTLATPNRRITQDKFLSSVLFGIYSLQGINYDQVRLPGTDVGSPIWQVRYFMFHSACYAVVWAYRSGKGEPKLIPGEYSVECGDSGYYLARYYRIGCTHPDSYEVTYRMFDHERKCDDCGWSFRYDSSG
jgi:hypothetical protein